MGILLICQRVTLICFILLCLGCHSVLSTGTYQGDLSVQGFPLVTDMKELPVEIQLQFQSRNHAIIDFQNFRDQKPLVKPVEIEFLSRNRIDVLIPDLIQGKVEFTRVFESALLCYESRARFEGLFCLEEMNFSLQLKDKNNPKVQLSLYGTRGFPDRTRAWYGLPKDLTVRSAIQLSLNQNLEIEAETEVLRRAQQAVKSAYLNLLPHLSFNSIASVATAIIDPSQLTGAVGDLVPFIFPTRWLQARKSQWQKKAAEAAFTLLKADIAYSTHVLAVNYMNHVALRDEVKSLKKVIKKLIPTLISYELNSGIQAGSVATLQTSHDDLKIEILQLDQQIEKDKSDLAHVLGLDSPDAIQSLVSEQETVSYEELKILKGDKLRREKEYFADLATSRSFELQQQGYLEKATRIGEAEVLLNWFDPQGDPNRNLGFNLIPEMKIARSLENAIQIKKKSIRQALIHHAFKTVDDRNQMLKLHRLAQSTLELRRKRLSQAIQTLQAEDIDTISSLSLIDFKEIVQDVYHGLESFYASRAGYQMNQVTLERLSLTGGYHQMVSLDSKSLKVLE